MIGQFRIAHCEGRCSGGYCTWQQQKRLEWTKMLHTFEGKMQDLQAEGKSKNSVQMIVVDVGWRSNEASDHGLIYTIFSTFGDAGFKDSIPYRCFNSCPLQQTWAFSTKFGISNSQNSNTWRIWQGTYVMHMGETPNETKKLKMSEIEVGDYTTGAP
jgi:hypothetical protein